LEGYGVRTKFFAVVAVLLVFAVCVPALANPQGNPPEQSKVSVVMFMDNLFLTDKKALEIVQKGLKERFGEANVAIYGDSSAKTPEFMEFIENVQSDPVNERGIRVIPQKHIIKYGLDTKSSHVVLITLQASDSHFGFWSASTSTRNREDVTVFAVNPAKIVLNTVYDSGEKLLQFQKAAQVSMDQLKNDFRWRPQAAIEDEVKPMPLNSVAVLVFLPDYLMEKPELVADVKKVLKEKIRNGDILVYNDFEAKSPDYLNFMGKVSADSALQKTFIIKKEHLTAFGKDAGYKGVVVFRVSVTDEISWCYRLKADVTVVAVGANRYLANQVFDTEKIMYRKEGVEFILNKFKAEFKLPAEAYVTED
jgi:hypothetical protein